MSANEMNAILTAFLNLVCASGKVSKIQVKLRRRGPNHYVLLLLTFSQLLRFFGVSQINRAPAR